MGEPIRQRQRGEIFFTFGHCDGLDCQGKVKVDESWQGAGVSKLCDRSSAHAV